MKPSFKYFCLILAVILQFPTLLSAAPVVSTDPAIEEEPAVAEKVKVVVTILPQKYIVEALGGDNVDVSVLIEPGMNPHVFEPLPQQMKAIAKAKIYFTVGIPFEKPLTQRFISIAPELKIVPSDALIKKRSMSGDTVPIPGFEKAHRHGHHHGHEEGLDPHIWMDPDNLSQMASNMAKELSGIVPEDILKSRLAKLQQDALRVKMSVANDLNKYKGRKFLTFHPSFGYFADKFGLKQIAIEYEGKEPTPRQLAAIIRFAKKEGVKTLFVQKQFASKATETLAKAIKGNIVYADPLPENVFTEILDLTGNLINSFKEQDIGK